MLDTDKALKGDSVIWEIVRLSLFLFPHVNRIVFVSVISAITITCTSFITHKADNKELLIVATSQHKSSL